MKKIYISMVLLTMAATTTLQGAPRERKSPVSPATERFTPAEAVSHGLLTVSRADAPRKAATATRMRVEGEVIDSPVGELKLYNRLNTGFINSFMGTFYGQFEAGGQIVWGENNEVYLRDPAASVEYAAWVKGTYADGKVTVELPQPVYYESYYDEFEGGVVEMYGYLSLCNYLAGEYGDTFAAVGEGETNSVTYTVAADGSLTLDLNSGDPTADFTPGDKLLGIVWDLDPTSEYAWSGFGVTYQTITPFAEEITRMSADCKPEDWAFVTGDGITGACQVGVDGTDLYVGGLFPPQPDACIKGTIADGKVTFPMGTFMGVNPDGQFAYMVAALFETDEWEEYAMLDQVVMNYDAEARTLAIDNPLLDMLVTTSREDVMEIFYDYFDCRFFWQDPELVNAAPQNPSFVSIMPYDEERWFGSIVWDIPALNVNGAVLDTSRMWYNLWFNGEKYTFTPDLYWEVPEDMTDVPYEYWDYTDFWVTGSEYDISFYEDYETYGCQSFYLGTDGVTYQSDLIEVDVNGNLGLESLLGNAEVISTRWYDLQGRALQDPQPGLCIRRDLLKGGIVRSAKVVVR